MKKSSKGGRSVSNRKEGKKETTSPKPELKNKSITGRRSKAPGPGASPDKRTPLTFGAESVSYINEKESQGVKNKSELIHGHQVTGMDAEQEDKFEFGFSFSPQQGDYGDESEDTGDLPEVLDKIGNRYNPALGTGEKKNKDFDEIINGMHITDASHLGMKPEEDEDTFSDEDEE